MTLRHPTCVALAAAFACGAAHGQDAAASIDFYANLYPEWKVQHFGRPSKAGTDVGTMGSLRNDTTVLSKNANPKAQFDGQEWSNSYVGVRGANAVGPVTIGFDLQGLVDLEGSVERNLHTRDAFVYVEHARAGRLSVGRMDSIYKEWGDPVRMFGVSSSNIVSTARTQSGVGWKAAGETTFNNRVSHMATWVSPAFAGAHAGISYSFDPVPTSPHLRSHLASAALQWRGGPWYAALATEVHTNWLPMSLAPDTPVPAATSIRNPAASTSSRDQGVRASMAWIEGPWRVGADLSRLRYTERSATPAAGKFRSYENVTGQVSVEYKRGAWRFGANHARATAGNCTLSGGVACSTHGLGGRQTSLGVMYGLTDILSVFALAVHTHNGAAAQYGSSAQGAAADAYALGIKVSVK